MVIGARKLLTSTLGLVLAGSLLGGTPASAAGVDAPDVGSAAPQAVYTGYEVSLAPSRAPAGEPVQLHGYIGDGGLRDPMIGVGATIYFDPAGTAPRTAVATVVTDDVGWFAKTFWPRTSGTYEVFMEDGGEIYGRNKATFTRRPTSQAARSTVVSATRNGYTAKMRVIAQDVVTKVEPQTVYLEAGILTPGYASSIYGPFMTNRRTEGGYDAGGYTGGRDGAWLTNYSFEASYRMSALQPAGLYDIYYFGKLSVYTDPWDTSGNGSRDNAWIPIPSEPIATIRVRRASSTTITASSTSFTGPRSIELSGSVHKVQLISDREAANLLAPNTAVNLYFDPAGPRGPFYRKTVRTGSRGIYRTTVSTSTSGQWIAKYPGTGLQAPSQRAVTITVR
jgi:hypothetical protein